MINYIYSPRQICKHAKSRIKRIKRTMEQSMRIVARLRKALAPAYVGCILLFTVRDCYLALSLMK